MNIELGLEKIRKLLFLLGNPERYLKVIHVAGTNGKGSVISYVNSILVKKGLKVGRYISPAVFDPLEIIQINGENITFEEYDSLMEEIEAVVFKMSKEPSQFEKETALAILYFMRKKCDVCIFETGLGGNLDATNVFRKVLCSVITSIDYDHMSFLGNSIEEIAEAKAGIIKMYCPVILAPQKYSTVFNIIKARAEKTFSSVMCINKNSISEDENAKLIYKTLSGKSFKGIVPINKALYQRDNINTAREVINVLNFYGYGISDEDIVQGINSAYWPGRFEKVNENPPVYMDGAHNPNGAEALKETLEKYFFDKELVFVMGIFKDKDYSKVVDIIAPMATQIYTFTPTNERGLLGEELKTEICRVNENVEACDSLEAALKKAITHKDKVVIVFGSLSYLKDVKGYFLNEDRQ